MRSEIPGFTIVAEHPSRFPWRMLDVIPSGTSDAVSLYLFDPDLSQKAEFRRAFKTDRAMLEMLRHQSIPRMLGAGEADGCLYLWTEQTDARSLSEWIASGRRFSSEDVVEIGWQLCSALQHAHNIGLSHGGLSCDSVQLSDNLQVAVTQFGCQRWLHAADAETGDRTPGGRVLITVSALASRQEVEQDLEDLARLLRQLHATATAEEPGNPAAAGLLERLLARALFPAGSGHKPQTAREFQGRLGEILIGGGDDAVPLVDQRAMEAGARRSIVDELFESHSEQSAEAGQQLAAPATRLQILPIGIAMLLVVLLFLLAEWLL